MWYIIMAVLIIGYFFFVKDFINAFFQMKQKKKAMDKIKGLINLIDEIKLVNGIPDIKDGSTVSLYLCNDRIAIDDNFFIPLNRVIEASAFRVRGVTLKENTLIGKTLAFCFCGLFGTQKTNFLSIEYIDLSGQQCNGLFITGDKPAKFFVDTINKKINFSKNSLPYNRDMAEFERTKWS